MIESLQGKVLCQQCVCKLLWLQFPLNPGQSSLGDPGTLIVHGNVGNQNAAHHTV